MTNEELFSSYDADLTNRYQSAKALGEARRLLRHFRNDLGQWPPSPEAGQRFLAQFSHLKPATRYRYTQIISSFFNWYGQPLGIKVRAPKKLPAYVEEDDIQRLLQAMTYRPTYKRNVTRDTLLVQLALGTGLRRSELANLKVGDLHLNQSILVVRGGKGNKDAVIPLTDTLLAKLKIYTKDMPSETSLFGLKPASISSKIERFAKKAGVKLHCHSFRHRFGTRLIERGANPEAVRQLMRHEDLGTTQRYVALVSSGLKETIQLIDDVTEPSDKGIPSSSSNIPQLPKLIAKKPEKKPTITITYMVG